MLPVKIMLVRGAATAGGGGGGGAQINIFDQSLVSVETTPITASIFYELANSGTGIASGQTNWTWLLSGLNSDYQVRATLLSGIAPSGDPLNSWLSLGSNRSWNLSQSSIGNSTASVFIEVRRVVDSIVVDSATISMRATVNDTL